MVESLTPEQIQEIQESFRLFDKDGDGSITTKEVSEIFHSLGQEVDEVEIEEMIREFDKDGNGEIDFDEFLEVMASRVMRTSPEQVMKEVFAVFDADNKDYINSDDLLRVMRGLNEEDPEEAKELFAAADVNGDGTIGNTTIRRTTDPSDYDEFVQLMTVRL